MSSSRGSLLMDIDGPAMEFVGDFQRMRKVH